MTHFKKIGLLLLNKEGTKFLVCEPGNRYLDKRVVTYLMPGGQMQEANDAECLQNEIREELNCEVDTDSLQFVNEYTGAAATPGAMVTIRLYRGTVIGTPVASTEIGALHWIGREDVANVRVSSIIRERIIPDLVARGILA